MTSMGPDIMVLKLLLLVVAFGRFSAGTDVDGWTCEGRFSKCYKYFPTRYAREKAEGLCVGLQSHLTSVHSTAENDFIRSMSENSEETPDNLWLGAIKSGDKWRWADASDFDFQPQNAELEGDEQQTCLGIWKHQDHKEGKWHALKCDWGMAYVCAKPYNSANAAGSNAASGSSSSNFGLKCFIFLLLVLASFM